MLEACIQIFNEELNLFLIALALIVSVMLTYVMNKTSVKA